MLQNSHLFPRWIPHWMPQIDLAAGVLDAKACMFHRAYQSSFRGVAATEKKLSLCTPPLDAGSYLTKWKKLLRLSSCCVIYLLGGSAFRLDGQPRIPLANLFRQIKVWRILVVGFSFFKIKEMWMLIGQNKKVIFCQFWTFKRFWTHHVNCPWTPRSVCEHGILSLEDQSSKPSTLDHHLEGDWMDPPENRTDLSRAWWPLLNWEITVLHQRKIRNN